MQHFSWVLAICFFGLFSHSAYSQQVYYVDPVNGSDAYTGTAPAFEEGNVGPKATIEGAAQAANEGETSAVILNGALYNRDESGVTTPDGHSGGNDADGILIQGDKDIKEVRSRAGQ